MPDTTMRNVDLFHGFHLLSIEVLILVHHICKLGIGYYPNVSHIYPNCIGFGTIDVFLFSSKEQAFRNMLIVYLSSDDVLNPF